MSKKELNSHFISKYGAEGAIDHKEQLKISFHSESEIDRIQKEQMFKICVRNILGLRHKDDWIFNLNIGNVMHLNLMGSDEMNNKLDPTHEFNKDAMLEKIVLISVAYFCIGTEMRFLAKQAAEKEYGKLKQPKEPFSSSMYKQKEAYRNSEMWHAKAVHLSNSFLPKNCPLLQHIRQSYVKNYVKDKMIKLELSKEPKHSLPNQTNTSKTGYSKASIPSQRVLA